MKKKRSGLMRVHNTFEECIKSILEKRKEQGLKEISLVEISLLITKHKSYPKIQSDMINYLGYEDE